MENTLALWAAAISTVASVDPRIDHYDFIDDSQLHYPGTGAGWRLSSLTIRQRLMVMALLVSRQLLC